MLKVDNLTFVKCVTVMKLLFYDKLAIVTAELACGLYRYAGSTEHGRHGTSEHARCAGHLPVPVHLTSVSAAAAATPAADYAAARCHFVASSLCV